MHQHSTLHGEIDSPQAEMSEKRVCTSMRHQRPTGFGRDPVGRARVGVEDGREGRESEDELRVE